MKINVLILILISSINCYSQNKNSDCEELKNGTFEIYENGEKVGIVYRKGNIQIEKYPNKEELNFVKLKYNNCNITYNSYEIKQELDTITWSVNYNKIKKFKYKFIAKPKYLNISYTSEGEIIKLSNEIKKEILKIYSELIITVNK